MRSIQLGVLQSNFNTVSGQKANIKRCLWSMIGKINFVEKKNAMVELKKYI